MRYLLLFCAWLNLTACSTQDQSYFSVHPKALQEAISRCPDEAPKQVSCDELHQLALTVNAYVYELRMSPQDYGQKILALQETIARQQQALKTHADVQTALLKNQAELRERLAIVNWLEAPES